MTSRASHSLLVLILALFVGCSSGETQTSPPSTPSTDWVAETQALESEANAHHSGPAGSSSTAVMNRLQSDLPILYNKMESDSNRASWLSLWGRCINFDELAKGIIISPPVIDAFLDFMHAPTGPSILVNNRQIVHAGVQHTYGYLFSNLQTAFGYKRERWVRNTIDRGFVLPERTIGPIPNEGTLFANATYFAGRIAFRNEWDLLAVLSDGSAGVSHALLNLNYDSIQVTRLEELINTPSGDVILRSDFVPFLKKVDGDSNTQLLIYSVADYRIGKAGTKLITLFPVNDGFVNGVLAPNTLGPNQPIQTRYNAYVEDISGQTWYGTRRKL